MILCQIQTLSSSHPICQKIPVMPDTHKTKAEGLRLILRYTTSTPEFRPQ